MVLEPVEPPLPEGWRWTTLAKTGQLLRGVSYRKEDASEQPKNDFVPILRATNIQAEKLVLASDLVYVPSRYVKTEQYLEPGDIVVCMSSGSKHLVGKTAQLVQEWTGSFGTFCAAIRPYSAVNPKFLGYFFSSPEYRQFIREKSAGININNLKPSDFETLEIPLPPLPVQARIVARLEEVLSDLEAGVAALERVRVGVKRYKASVLKSACEGKVVERDTSDEPVADLLDRVQKEKSRLVHTGVIQKSDPTPEINDDEKTFELPRGWIWVRLDEICSLIADIAHKMPRSVEDGVKFISAKDLIDNGKINFENDVKRISEKDYEALARRVRPQRNDIVYSRIGARLGKARVVETDERFMVSYSCCIIRPVDVDVLYLSYYLDSGTVLLQARTQAKSIGVPDLGMRNIKNFVIALPPLEEQRRVVAEVDRRLESARAVEAAVQVGLKRAARLRQAVLRSAFEGTL